MNDETSNLSVGEIVGDVGGKEAQVIAFYLNSELVGIPIEKVIEIAVNRDITPVPKSASYISGVMNLRGKIVPVVDLKRYGGIGKFSGEALRKNNIVIVETLKGEVGILADRIAGSIRFMENSVVPEPIGSIGIDTEYITGVVQVNEDLLVILDINAIFH